MAKKIKVVIKLQIVGGQANPHSSSLYSSLKPIGFNISATGNSRFPTPSRRGIGS